MGDIPGGFGLIETPAERLAREQAADLRRDRRQRQLQLWFNGILMFATIVTAVAVIYQGFVLREQTDATKTSADAAKKGADAAKSAADTAAMQFEAVERPRVSGKLSFTKPLVIDRNGLHVDFKMTFTNTGATNAINAFAAANIFPLQLSGPDTSAERDRLCKVASESTSRFRFTIYAQQDGEMGFGMPINRRDLDSAAGRLGGVVVPAIVVCIAYQPSFNAKIFYHTGFIYQISYIQDPTSPKRMVIPVKDGMIPVEKLDIHATGGKPEISPD